MTNSKFFKLFASCIPVKGAKRAVICDIQRKDIYFIAPIIYETIMESEGKNKDQIYQQSKLSQENLDKVFNFLLEKDLGFWSSNPENFPKLDLTWKSPNFITDSIIEIDELRIKELQSILEQLSKLKCKFIELRAYHSAPLQKIEAFLKKCLETPVRSLIINCQYNELINWEEVNRILGTYQRVLSLIFHSTPNGFQRPKTLTSEIEGKDKRVFFINQSINSEKCCGHISAKYFEINRDVFTESQQYNTCLNRKLSIDSKGNIKNCPSMQKAFGNIKNKSLEEVVNDSDFQKYWTIKKEEIHVCKDCEFRHVCTDCRAYIEDPNDLYSKPLKCGYNPYTAEWTEWGNLPEKQKAINYYNMKDFTIAINK